MVDQLKTEINELISNNRVVLFMKGTPLMPRCGFSERVVQILDLCGVRNYKSIDMLARPDLVNPLVVYADWPTLPVLYINGEFVGGCDITQEMYQQGELQLLLSSA